MTLANQITIGRLILLPVFIVLIMSYTQGDALYRILALVVFVVAAVSDAVDGFIARAYDQKTRLGTVLDPLADKLLINCAFIFLAVNDQFATQVPYWLPVVVLSRDVFIVMGSYFVNEFYGPIRVKPRLLGKLNTFMQMFSITVVLLEWRYAFETLMVMVAVVALSMIDYAYAGSKQVRAEEKQG